VELDGLDELGGRRREDEVDGVGGVEGDLLGGDLFVFV